MGCQYRLAQSKMAVKRMISKQIIDSDAFMDMPLSAQALYFHLLARADDDGFIGNGRALARAVSASGDDLKLLIAKGFLLSFESGVVAVTHWRIHNHIAKDRYTPTTYTTEMTMLMLLPTKAYALKESFPQDNPQIFPQSYPQSLPQCDNWNDEITSPQGFPQNSPVRAQSVYSPNTVCIQDDMQTVYRAETGCIQNVGADIDKDKDIDLDIDDDVNTNVEQKKDDGETDDDKNADKEKVPPEPVDPETFQGWFKKEANSGSDTSASDKPRRNPTPAEDMADKVGQLFRQLLPLLPYAGVPDKLVVDIARAGKPLDYYQAVFERAAASSYLREPHGGKNWCCSLGWLCKPENAEKVLSGRYDDFAKSGKAQVQEPQGVTMVNGVENGFETSPMFEAALQRGIKKMAELRQTMQKAEAQEAQSDDKV